MTHKSGADHESENRQSWRALGRAAMVFECRNAAPGHLLFGTLFVVMDFHLERGNHCLCAAL